MTKEQKIVYSTIGGGNYEVQLVELPSRKIIDRIRSSNWLMRHIIKDELLHRHNDLKNITK